jgi:hypothetical protein
MQIINGPRPRVNVSFAHAARRPTFKPTGIAPYIDKLQAWLKSPADRRTLTKLTRHCGQGGLFAKNERAPFGQGYQQRLELRQPSPEALQWLAQRDDVLINRVEIALDYIFESPNTRDEALEFLHFHLIRRWHSKKQKIRLYRASKELDSRGNRKAKRVSEIREAQTRYDLGRWSKNAITLYTERYSRVTGELFCLHVEWRANVLRAVQAAGIKSAADLLQFDHHAFWKKRLLLVDVDIERLGRLFRNSARKTRSRTTAFETDWAGRKINNDRCWGGVIVGSVGSLQELLDTYRGLVRLHRALRPISNSAWLPPQGS